MAFFTQMSVYVRCIDLKHRKEGISSVHLSQLPEFIMLLSAQASHWWFH